MICMTQTLSSTVRLPDAPKPLVAIFGGDEETRFLYQTMLEMWDYLTAEAECIDSLTQLIRFKTPDLILMDMTLPLIESLTALSEIRKNKVLNKTPIVLVSGFAQPQYRFAALELGADEYLVKPVDFRCLETTLEKYIRRGLEPKAIL